MSKIKWPQKLTIVRHGQSEQNAALDLFQDDLDGVLAQQKKIRDADIRLTSTGIFQAQETGKFLASKTPYDICLVSPYERAVQTSAIIRQQLNYNLTTYKDYRLREKEFGRLHGYTTQEIKNKFPEEYEDRQRDGKFYYRLPRGENYLDVLDRLYSFLSKLSRDYVSKNILIVTHHVPYILFKAIFEHLDEREVLV